MAQLSCCSKIALVRVPNMLVSTAATPFLERKFMRRRELIAVLGGIAVWPASVHAAQPAKLPIVGFIIPGTEQSHGKWVAAFTARMAELAWIDGRTVVLAYRWAAGHPDRYPEMAAELATLGADVVVTSVYGGAAAMRQAAPQTPIVMTALSTGSFVAPSLAIFRFRSRPNLIS
jgi:putative ABC transport system substrate-binding protein